MDTEALIEKIREEGKRSLEENVVNLLKEKKLTVALAESCTGGAIAARIVNVPGASDVFGTGFVTYSNEAKQKNLGVSAHTLETKGAVSRECAAEMAEGCRLAAGSDFGISVTGLAGPGGGTEETPVGTVFIGCCLEKQVIVKAYHFSGERAEVREQAVSHALALLLDCIRSESCASDG